MSLDERLSGLQKQMGKDPNADTAAEILRLKMRLGQLAEERIRLCASIGSKVCLKIFPKEPEKSLYEIVSRSINDPGFAKNLALWASEKSLIAIEKIYPNHQVFEVAQKVLLSAKEFQKNRDMDWDAIIRLESFHRNMGSSGFSDPGHWEARDAVAAVLEAARSLTMGTNPLIYSRSLASLRLASDSLKTTPNELMVEFLLFDS